MIGHGAGKDATTATQTTICGSHALTNLTTGAKNVALGWGALSTVTTGASNTAVGSLAGNACTGNNNVFIGEDAGDNATSGNNNIVIGANADLTAADSSGHIVLGTTSNTDLRCNDQSISALSDARDKTEVVDLPVGLTFLNSLRPVKFKWATRDGNAKDGTTRAGFLAQDLQVAQKIANI